MTCPLGRMIYRVIMSLLFALLSTRFLILYVMTTVNEGVNQVRFLSVYVTIQVYQNATRPQYNSIPDDFNQASPYHSTFPPRSVVISDHPPFDDLLLDAVFLSLRLLVWLRPYHHPRFHRRRIFVWPPPLDSDALEDGALHRRDQAHVIVSVSEVEQRQAHIATLVRGRLEDAVDGRLVVSPREHLHRVADIHNLRQGSTVSVVAEARAQEVRTMLLGMYSTKRHCPSGDKI